LSRKSTRNKLRLQQFRPCLAANGSARRHHDLLVWQPEPAEPD